MSGPTVCGLGVMTSETCVVCGLRALANTRVIKSRSVRIPNMLPALSMMSTLLELALVMMQAASHTLACCGKVMAWRWVRDWNTVRSDMTRFLSYSGFQDGSRQGLVLT